MGLVLGYSLGIVCLFLIRLLGWKKKEEKGLADLKNGVDIKTLTMAASRNTVDSYLRNTSKKLDATTVIFDNVDNHGASDDEIIQWIRRSQRFKRGKIYILSQGSALIRIR